MLSDASPLQLLAGAVGAYTLYVVGRFLARRQPGDQVIVIGSTALSIPLATVYPPKKWFGSYYAGFIPYQNAGKTVAQLIFPPNGQRLCYVGDAAALKQIFNDRHSFVKNTKGYKLISFFGENIVGTEGDTWVRHRSIARKSFGERNNALLWTETVSTLSEWFNDWDRAIAQSTTTPRSTTVNITESLRDITLFVIASAGFGMHFSRNSTEKPSGYSMPFFESLFTAIDTMVIKVFAPNWMYNLPIRSLKHSDAAYRDLKKYIQVMIDEARNGQHISGEKKGSEEAADLFRRLIAANEEEDGGAPLSDDELLSNIYAFFLAGHETSAHTLTFAMALLAIHPDIQEKVFQEAKAIWPDVSPEWNNSTHVDYNKLDYTLAVFRETLRLFPAVVRVMRYAATDAVLPCHVRNPVTNEWEPSRTSVKKGVVMACNIGAVHMNPMYWGDDVDVFKPERFIDTESYTWPRDAWVPFTGGPRVCLGQRFAMVESVCILARLIRKYRITPTADVAKLPKRAQWEKLTKHSIGVTATPYRVDLVFEPRD